MCFDRMDYCYERVLESCCRMEKKELDALASKDRDEIALRAYAVWK